MEKYRILCELICKVQFGEETAEEELMIQSKLWCFSNAYKKIGEE